MIRDRGNVGVVSRAGLGNSLLRLCQCAKAVGYPGHVFVNPVDELLVLAVPCDRFAHIWSCSR